MPELTREEIKQKTALIMLRSGLATVSEVAPLRGVSRQAMQQASRDIQPRQKRAAYVKFMWKKIHKRLTG
jgi:hypothetical protein